ncbi:unnamed protein product [Sphagnum troendelagicum]|uniref:Uncharacterized protein n=1 Tax=Sphagnum troendelagicum TaxID=128251 RepID=A0ABP0UBH6_9BRYO
MVAMWYCCDCGLLNESTHHNAVYCHCDHHVCGECRHAKRKSSHHHHNHDLHDSHGVRRATKLKLFTTIMIRVMKWLFKLAPTFSPVFW